MILEPIIFSVTTIDGSMSISGLVATMTATDEDDDALTFSITGGEDAELFSIDPLTGAIRLTTVIEPAAPPLDADGDMRCFIEVTVSDGQAMDTETVQLHLDPGSIQNHAPFLQEPVIFSVPSFDFDTQTLAAVLRGLVVRPKRLHPGSESSCANVSARRTTAAARGFSTERSAEKRPIYGRSFGSSLSCTA